MSSYTSPDYQTMTHEQLVARCLILTSTYSFLLPHMKLSAKRALRTHLRGDAMETLKPHGRESASGRAAIEALEELLTDVSFWIENHRPGSAVL